ncbi:MAG: D-cysteine desulfhydrase family protein [Chloroflexi bacterium]|nr:D-cysteine desulfhydrase family protein [Chloroflexota bacterium]
MAARDRSTITVKNFRKALDALPRAQLANLPTPLDFCPRLTAHLGGPDVYIKRDDLTGLALGGNKTRNLEFLFGEAIAQGADCIITGAYPQSNQCRQTAAAAAKLGLECYLVLGAQRHRADVQGNLLLDHLFGARVEIAPEADDVGVQAIIDERLEELQAQGRRPYRFTNKYPELAVKSVAGYLSGMLELHAQLQDLPEQPTTIVVTSGSGSTHTGIASAVKALGLPYHVTGISIRPQNPPQRERIATLSQSAAAHYGIPCALTPDEVDVREEYFGAGHGVTTAAGREAVLTIARTEGILLDLTYTGKAMSGLIDLVRNGTFSKNERVVFVHTGGIPSLFAHADEALA